VGAPVVHLTGEHSGFRRRQARGAAQNAGRHRGRSYAPTCLIYADRQRSSDDAKRLVEGVGRRGLDRLRGEGGGRELEQLLGQRPGA